MASTMQALVVESVEYLKNHLAGLENNALKSVANAPSSIGMIPLSYIYVCVCVCVCMSMCVHLVNF